MRAAKGRSLTSRGPKARIIHEIEGALRADAPDGTWPQRTEMCSRTETRT